MHHLSASGARAGQTRQDEILAAAAELFLAEGYGAASMNKLIDRVSGSKATIYALFGNKERLFEAVVENIIDGTEDFVTARDVEGMPLREGLIAIGRKLIETATSESHVALARLVIAESPRFPELGRIFHERTSARFIRILSRFIAAHATGVARSKPTELAEMFTGMLLHHLLFEQFCGIGTSASPARARKLAIQAAEVVLSAFVPPQTSRRIGDWP